MAKSHLVEDGEYLTLIARRYGFVTNKALLDANAELFAERRNPDVLNPGDVLVIPDKRVKLVPRATTQTHTFRLEPRVDWLRVVLKDYDGELIKNQPFTLRVQAAGAAAVSGLEIPGDTGSAGLVEAALPPGAVKAYLVLDKMPWLSWELQIGRLDPTRDKVDQKTIVKGVQARLNNLGFHCGNVDGVLGPRTKAAIAHFQWKKMGREEPSGKLDRATREQIEAEHQI